MLEVGSKLKIPSFVVTGKTSGESDTVLSGKVYGRTKRWCYVPCHGTECLLVMNSPSGAGVRY